MITSEKESANESTYAYGKYTKSLALELDSLITTGGEKTGIWTN